MTYRWLAPPLKLWRHAVSRQIPSSDYGLDPGLITSIRGDIEKVRVLTSTREETSSKSVAATKIIRENISALRKQPDVLDDLVFGTITDVEFLHVYSNARQIVDR